MVAVATRRLEMLPGKTKIKVILPVQQKFIFASSICWFVFQSHRMPPPSPSRYHHVRLRRQDLSFFSPSFRSPRPRQAAVAAVATLRPTAGRHLIRRRQPRLPHTPPAPPSIACRTVPTSHDRRPSAVHAAASSSPTDDTSLLPLLCRSQASVLVESGQVRF